MRRGQKNPLTCPVCGGHVRRTRGQLEGWVLPEKYYCDACKYTGFLVLEREPDVDDRPARPRSRVD